MNRRTVVFILLQTLVVAHFVQAQEASPESTDPPWLDVDFGPFLRASFEGPGLRHIVKKGLAISLHDSLSNDVR